MVLQPGEILDILTKKGKNNRFAFLAQVDVLEGYDTNQRGTKSGPNGEQKYNLYLRKAIKMLS